MIRILSLALLVVVSFSYSASADTWPADLKRKIRIHNNCDYPLKIQVHYSPKYDDWRTTGIFNFRAHRSATIVDRNDAHYYHRDNAYIYVRATSNDGESLYYTTNDLEAVIKVGNRELTFHRKERFLSGKFLHIMFCEISEPDE